MTGGPVVSTVNQHTTVTREHMKLAMGLCAGVLTLVSLVAIGIFIYRWRNRVYTGRHQPL